MNFPLQPVVFSCAITVVASTSAQAEEFEISKELCLEAVESLRLPTSPYGFEKGWLRDKHLFGGAAIECYEKNDKLFVSFEGDPVVEDGFFGVEALSARDATLELQKNEVDSLKEVRDGSIDEARESYRSSIDALEKETQRQLQAIREGNEFNAPDFGLEQAERSPSDTEARPDKVNIVSANIEGLNSKGRNDLVLEMDPGLEGFYELAYTLKIQTENGFRVESYQYPLRTRGEGTMWRIDLMEWLLPNTEEKRILSREIRPGNVEWIRIVIMDQSADGYKEIANQEFRSL